jgi:hypothetical protein
LSLCPAVAEAVRVWPSCAVPVIVGFLTVGAASTTAVVVALAVVVPNLSTVVTLSVSVWPSSLSWTR